MRKLLQNHPGLQDFSIKVLKILQICRDNSHTAKHKSLLWIWTFINTLFLITSIFGLVVFAVIVWFFLSEGIKNGVNVMQLVLISVASLLPSIFWGIFYWLTVVRRVKIEQEQYYKARNIAFLPLAKREALRLDMVIVFEGGQWSETLETWPLLEYAQIDRFKYRVLPLSPFEDHKEGLFSDWNIVDEKGYNDAIQALWSGMHSQSFAHNSYVEETGASGEQYSKLVRQLSALVDISPEWILRCKLKVDGQPPLLLWGFDLRRAIALSRNCFCAGFISEERAWHDILITSAYAHGIFNSFEEYYDNYRLGHAYWCMDHEQAKLRKEGWEQFQKKCQWPIAKLPWIKRSPIVLPEYIQLGFKEPTEELKDEEMWHHC